ncbi:hypothetical protein QF040_001453 [Variovorax sp. W2I14]
MESPNCPSRGVATQGKQIRVCWRSDIAHHEDDEHCDGGLWVEMTCAALREAAAICEVQDARHGAGSHWIAERTRSDSEFAGRFSNVAAAETVRGRTESRSLSQSKA